MFEILSYDFILRAMIAGVATAITAAIVGNFIVAARQAIISDMLAHAALAGVGLGMFLGVSPGFFAGATAIVASIFLWFLTKQSGRAPDAVSMLLLTGGLAVALLFSHAAKETAVSFESFLFGSILTITYGELLYFTAACACIVVVFLTLWRRFLTSVFDPQFARVQSKIAPVYEIILLVSTGALVAVSLKVIGGLLVGALLVIPVLTAQNIATSFRANVLWSIVWGIAGVIGGITASFYFDIPASSGIVLSLITLFAATYFFKKLIER